MSLPKPYYDQDGITIYHTDCRDILPLLEPDSIDLVLTDPPYGVDRVGWNDKAEDVRLSEWVSQWLTVAPYALFSGMAKGVWNLGQTLNGVCEIYRVLVWHKPMVLNGGRANFTWHWEPIVFVGRIGTKAPWKPFYVSDVISVSPPAFRTHPENQPHNSQKPLMLMRTLIEPLTEVDGVILDPFMGSGTTLRAAKDLGRKAIGIEIEEKYCEIAVQRLAQQVLPLEVA